MKILMKIIFLGFMINTGIAQECPEDRADYFCITPEMAPNTLISEFDFYAIPIKLIAEFKAPLILEANWKSPYFGAGVYFHESAYRLMILGGTTRIEGMSVDAYAALVCHEIGHLIGGAPYQTIPGAEWSSSEGQSDFFAASVCLPRYYAKMGVAKNLIAARVERAGFELMRSFIKIERAELIRFKKDDRIVKETLINNYPSLQCRYENFRNNKVRPSCWFK